MVLNPRVMEKAQAELDRVVGKGRLPDFSDWDDLPYINAIVKEVIRWNPPPPYRRPNQSHTGRRIPGAFHPGRSNHCPKHLGDLSRSEHLPRPRNIQSGQVPEGRENRPIGA